MEDYKAGYDAAKQEMKNNYTAQELYNQRMDSISDDDFDKGWTAACLEEGAIEV